jgi:hypothetical protein
MEDIMTVFLREQLEEQRTVIEANERFMAEAPEGRLKVRRGKGEDVYIRSIAGDKFEGGRHEYKIGDDTDMVDRLVQKEVSMETIARCESNIKVIGNTMKKYQSLMPADVRESLKPNIQSLVRETQPHIFRIWENEDYVKRVDYEGINIHETLKGDMVASKSEVIIADALYNFHIPYHYDECSYILSPKGRYYYYDFKILLPNGEFYYWEHFGMLHKSGYFQHNLEKLYRYHMNGIDFGKNLIITVDGAKQNCESKVIYSSIENCLMPYFR